MLNSHNDIRFIIIDYGFTRKTVYKAKEKYRGMFEIQKSGEKTSSGEMGLDIKHSLSNYNVLVRIHLSKYIPFN